MKKMSKSVAALVTVLMAGVVHSGPPVEVTFKNLGSQRAVLKLSTTNESSTFQIADPKPDQSVEPGAETFARVKRVISPDVNSAQLRYTIGSKTCAFGTIYQMRTLAGGIKKPEWTKSANPSGGATCSATITRTGADYSWAVEFTMK